MVTFSALKGIAHILKMLEGCGGRTGCQPVTQKGSKIKGEEAREFNVAREEVKNESWCSVQRSYSLLVTRALSRIPTLPC